MAPESHLAGHTLAFLVLLGPFCWMLGSPRGVRGAGGRTPGNSHDPSRDLSSITSFCFLTSTGLQQIDGCAGLLWIMLLLSLQVCA